MASISVFFIVGRKLRYLPDDSHLVEVTCRVLQRRYLLRPDPRLNALIIGTLAHFQARHGMLICGFVYMSNHCHLLLRPKSVEQLAAFMRDVNSKIAREAGRLYKWREKLWSRRYTDVVVSHEPEAQVSRLRYLLEQGCKEGLVASPRHWPGASSTQALLRGEPAEGVWIDRSQQHLASKRVRPRSTTEFTSNKRLELSPLPCWDDLAAHRIQTLVRFLIREIEAAMEGVEVSGKDAVLRQNPRSHPSSEPTRTGAPRFHAVAPKVRQGLEIGYRLVRDAYQRAFEDQRAGRRASFPAGCFAPGQFVAMPLRR